MTESTKPHLILSPGQIPFYGVLSGYEWLGDFLKAQDLKQQIFKVEEERREIKRLKTTAADFSEFVRASYDVYIARRRECIEQFLEQSWDSPDPLKYFEGYAEKHLPPYVDWSEFEHALEELSDFGEIPKETQSKNLQKLGDTIETLKTDLGRVSPERFFMRNDAKILVNIQEEFVLFWRDIQEGMTAPAGPRGFDLELSPEAERAAWKKLGLKEAINPDARYHPNPG